jgi:peptide/nickel transport system permease protein
MRSISIAANPSLLANRYFKSISIIFDSPVAIFGLSLVVFWVIVSLVSLCWTPFEPNDINFKPNLHPNSLNWLGTDHMGRDILSRIMKGSQVILLKTRLPSIGISIPGGVAIWGVIGSLAVGGFLGLNWI